MTVTVTTDEEADRVLALRASRDLPLPPEIALCPAPEAAALHRWLGFYEAFGLLGHPLVRLFAARRIAAAEARAVAAAPHLERVCHLAAWEGRDPVRVVDLTGRAAGTAAPSPPSPEPIPAISPLDGGTAPPGP